MRINGDSSQKQSNKAVAYLLDKQTISVKDLTSQSSTLINHECVVDFLELNDGCNLLIFRDISQSLYIYDVESQSRRTLLSGSCSYVQWVPDSDVIVAQCDISMRVWYNPSVSDEVRLKDLRYNLFVYLKHFHSLLSIHAVRLMEALKVLSDLRTELKF